MEMVSCTSICSLTSLLHPVPSAAPKLLHTNKRSAAGSPEATGWTTEEGAPRSDAINHSEATQTHT